MLRCGPDFGNYSYRDLYDSAKSDFGDKPESDRSGRANTLTLSDLR